jgi:hypothetical protein
MNDPTDAHFPVHLDINHLPEPEWDYRKAWIRKIAADRFKAREKATACNSFFAVTRKESCLFVE